MRKLARLFSVLSIVAVLWGIWLIVAPELPDRRPAPRPEATLPDPAPGSRGPFPLEDLRRALPGIFRPQEAPAALTSPIRRILIEKGARRMTVWQQDGPPRTYTVQLGFSPEGTKTRQGDGRTPEGVFRIDRLNPQSRFRLSLGLDYPQASHRQAARAGGYDPGGDIMIHGQPNQIPQGYRVKGDWTEGCIAVTNDEIEEIYAMARIGTEVEIRP